eukprot:gnl/Spiro4/4353_TR2161_c0_g1_i1.p1 gnl/Spiro4/4353_TR2161_c0_g1~~gnl/Spiro4/4353_TR2161_c0_g1_i1.p1  ORF type:complete len:378 (+),score=72.58 gnl/Spiro4/4353_TR2161_c0_g1_i1:87-1136(+)
MDKPSDVHSTAPSSPTKLFALPVSPTKMPTILRRRLGSPRLLAGPALPQPQTCANALKPAPNEASGTCAPAAAAMVTGIHTLAALATGTLHEEISPPSTPVPRPMPTSPRSSARRVPVSSSSAASAVTAHQSSRSAPTSPQGASRRKSRVTVDVVLDERALVSHLNRGLKRPRDSSVPRSASRSRRSKRAAISADERPPLRCRLCSQPVQRPASDRDGYLHCYSCLSSHVAQHGCSPVLNTPMRPADVILLHLEALPPACSSSRMLVPSMPTDLGRVLDNLHALCTQVCALHGTVPPAAAAGAVATEAAALHKQTLRKVLLDNRTLLQTTGEQLNLILALLPVNGTGGD